MRLVEQTARFLTYCSEERNLAPNTILAYRQDLNDLVAYGGRSPRALSALDPTDFVAHLTARGLAPRTVRRRLACVRRFVKWLSRAGLIAQNPFANSEVRVHVPQQLPRCLSEHEVKRILARRHDVGLACSLAVLLLLNTGMRVSELTALRIEDVDLRDGRIRVMGKGRREREVFVTDPIAREELRGFVHGPGADGSAHVLRDSAPVNSATLRRRFRRLGRLARLNRTLTPHMLRHTTATMLLERGVDIRFVQRLLGHRSIATTEMYTHVTTKALRAAVKRADILRGFDLAKIT